MITRGDKTLIIFILLVALFIFVGFQVYGFTGGRTYAIIEVDGNPYQKVSLGEDGPQLKINVPVPYGENVVEIDRDKVRMFYADCPDGDCVRQGWISRPGQIIVCLPNRMVIKIESDDKLTQKDVDAVSF
ncbi:MAG: NusG domain II-containing protein [Tepidanaerobacteraceae bacterium]|nr:NusG domain II-containing protein [Tepidanaerobacteraceae bacterium]